MATTHQRLLLYPLLWHIYLIGLQYYWSCYLNQITNYGKKAEQCGGTSGKHFDTREKAESYIIDEALAFWLNDDDWPTKDKPWVYFRNVPQKLQK